MTLSMLLLLVICILLNVYYLTQFRDTKSFQDEEQHNLSHFGLKATIHISVLDKQTGKDPTTYTTSPITSLVTAQSNCCDSERASFASVKGKINLQERIRGDSKCEIPGHYVICPNPRGRLGNQMFELAATIGIAQTLDYSPIINASHPLIELFSLDNVKIVPWSHVDNVLAVDKREWLSDNWINNYKDYTDHNLTISGYFQTWKSFSKVQEDVRRAFTIKMNYLTKAEIFLTTNIPSTKTRVGVHVRRGDFLSENSKQKGRTVADGNYTSKAMNFFRQRYKNVQFVICSNDLDWCKNNIFGDDVIFSNFTEAILDMAVMSLCDHMVITAGSFSWWGGFLSRGTVVYLKDFAVIPPEFVANSTFKEDYYPTEWIGITNGI